MTGVRFITVSELSRKATAIVSDAVKAKVQIVITKKGKPVALLKKLGRADMGKSETVTYLKNNAIKVVEAIDEKDKCFIITRDGERIAVILRITDDAFSIRKQKVGAHGKKA